MSDQLTSILRDLGVLLVSGVFAQLARIWLGQVRALKVEIEKMAGEVQRHGESLARGAERFRSLEERTARIRDDVDDLMRKRRR